MLIVLMSLVAEGTPQLALQLARQWQQDGLNVEVLVMPRPAFQGLFGGESANEALLARVEILRSQRSETNRERLSRVQLAGKALCYTNSF